MEFIPSGFLIKYTFRFPYPQKYIRKKVRNSISSVYICDEYAAGQRVVICNLLAKHKRLKILS